MLIAMATIASKSTELDALIMLFFQSACHGNVIPCISAIGVYWRFKLDAVIHVA